MPSHKDIEQKQNSDINKGHYSITNKQNMEGSIST